MANMSRSWSALSATLSTYALRDSWTRGLPILLGKYVFRVFTSQSNTWGILGIYFPNKKYPTGVANVLTPVFEVIMKQFRELGNSP